MASILDNKDKLDAQQTQAPGLTQTAPASSSTPSQGKPVASGRFTGVQKYIQANKPQQFAGQVANQVIGQGQAVKQNVGQSQQQFEQGAQAGRVDTAENIGAVKSIYDPANTQRFAGVLKSTGYQGPQGLANAQALQAQAQQAQQTGQMLASAPGKSQVVEQLYGRPTYSTGQKRFDTLLLGQDRSGALQQARARTSQLQGMAGQADIGAQQRAQELAKTSQALIGEAKDTYGREVGTSAADITNQANAISQQRKNQLDDIKGQIKQGRLSGEDLSGLGLSVGDMMYVSPESFLQGENTQVSAAQVATPEQQAKMRVLSQIAQQSGQGAQGLDVVNQVANAEQVGKLDPLYGYNKTGFINANEAAKAKYLADQAELAQSEEDWKRSGAAYNANPFKTIQVRNESAIPGNALLGAAALAPGIGAAAMGANPFLTGSSNIESPAAKAMREDMEAKQAVYNRRQAAFHNQWDNIKKAMGR